MSRTKRYLLNEYIEFKNTVFYISLDTVLLLRGTLNNHNLWDIIKTHIYFYLPLAL